MDATPSMHSIANNSARPVRQASSPVVSVVPDTLIVRPVFSCPSSSRPVTSAVAATTTTVSSTNAITDTSLATSSRVRPTGRISR